jgi:hypothetical protein
MNARHARAVCLALSLGIVGCKEGLSPFFGPFPPSNPVIEGEAVLPADCAPAAFDLDGTVWRVTGTAESGGSSCAWPVGQTRVLCEMEWTFTHIHAGGDAGRYNVFARFPDNGASGGFSARMCGEDLYLSGMLHMRLESTGCETDAASTSGVFIGEGTPPVTWVSLAEGTPGSGVAEVGGGVVDVQVGYGNCEMELVLEMTLVDVAPFARGAGAEPGARGTGGVVLRVEPGIVRELARAELGLLVRGAERQWPWLPVALFTRGDGVEVELAAGGWSVAIAARPGGEPDGGEAVAVVEVHAGERTALDVGFADRAGLRD